MARPPGCPGRLFDYVTTMQTYFRIFLSAAKMSWAMYSVELTPVVLFGSKIPRAVLQALFFVFIAKAAGGMELAKFALIGNAVHAAVFPAIIYMAIVIELEKWAGTLPHLIASPANWLPVLMGRSTATFGDAIFSTTIVLGILVPLIAPDIAILNLLRAIPVLFITVASAAGLGWLVGAISLPLRWGSLISNMTGYAMMVTCGVNFPLLALPPAIQWLGRCLPMTHGLLAVRALVDGAAYSDVAGLAGTEILIGVIYAVAAWALFRYRLRVARAQGTFEQV